MKESCRVFVVLKELSKLFLESLSTFDDADVSKIPFSPKTDAKADLLRKVRKNDEM